MYVLVRVHVFLWSCICGCTVFVDMLELWHQERNNWIMSRLEEMYAGDDLGRLSRVRVHQQVLLLLDVVGVLGCSLDKQYLRRHMPEEQWSDLTLALEDPPPQDFRL